MDKLSLLAGTDALYFFPPPRRNLSPCRLSFRNKDLRGPATSLETFSVLVTELGCMSSQLLGVDTSTLRS